MNAEHKARIPDPDKPLSEMEQVALGVYREILDASDINNPKRRIMLRYVGSGVRAEAGIHFTELNPWDLSVVSYADRRLLIVTNYPRISNDVQTHVGNLNGVTGLFSPEETHSGLLQVIDEKLHPEINGKEHRRKFAIVQSGGRYFGVEVDPEPLGMYAIGEKQEFTDAEVLDVIERTRRLAAIPPAIVKSFGTYDRFMHSLRNALGGEPESGVVTDVDEDDHTDMRHAGAVFGTSLDGSNSLSDFVYLYSPEARKKAEEFQHEQEEGLKRREMERKIYEEKKTAMSDRKRERAALGLADDTSYDERQRELLHFLERVFTQVRFMEDKKRDKKGHYHQAFDEVLGDATEKLRQLDPNLPHQLLMPDWAIGGVMKELYDSLPEERREQITALRDEKGEGLEKLIEGQIVPAMRDQYLTSGTLNTPPYHQQWGEEGRSTTCTNASIRMLFHAITGERIDERTLQDAKETFLRMNGEKKGRLLHDEEYLSIFRTPAFRESHGRKVASLRLSGLTLTDIGELAKNIRERAEDADLEIYCMISLATDRPFALANDIVAWHSAILLSSQRDNVTIHDPSEVTGSASRVIPKDEFVRRWAKTFLRGHLVVANQSPSWTESSRRKRL